jgi:acyl-CoA synthetase (AMP-forming)/AMP-acid ligase II
MKKSQRLLTYAMSVMLCSTGWARLGETPEQCEERYGTAIAVDDADKAFDPRGATIALYEKAGLEIFVTFYRGSAVLLTFKRLHKNALGNLDLSPTEVASLLNANAAGKEWGSVVWGRWGLPENNVTRSGNEPHCYLTDGAATAVYEDGMLKIVNRGYDALQKAAREDSEQKNLEEF